MAREKIALTHAFPKDKDAFIWESIQQAVKDSQSLREALEKARDDPDYQDNLMEYVGFQVRL